MGTRTILASDLRKDVVIVYGNVRVTILADEPESWTDLFQRPMLKIWARREDTGAEGWLPFGPGGMFPLA